MTKRVALKTVRRAVVNDAELEAARENVRAAEAAVEALENQDEDEEGGDGDTHIHIHTSEQAGASQTTDERFAAIETGLQGVVATVAELAALIKPAGGPGGSGDPAVAQATADAAALAKAKEEAEGKGDSKALAPSYSQLLAQAEVLVPGFRMPTFDATATRATTVDNMCQARRRCLELAYATKDGQQLIDGISATKDLDLAKMDCKEAAILFNAASGAKALINNRVSVGDGKAGKIVEQPKVHKMPTLAEQNVANAEFWAKQQTTAGA